MLLPNQTRLKFAQDLKLAMSLLCGCLCHTKPNWSLTKLLCCYYSADIRLLCGCYHTMLIVSNLEISWKLRNMVKMLKSSPLVQKHGMAGGPYTCWDKFCTFLLSDLACNWVENFASHFPSKNISYKERLMSKIHEKVVLDYRKSEKAEYEVHPPTTTPSPPTQTDLDIYCQLEI